MIDYSQITSLCELVPLWFFELNSNLKYVIPILPE